MIEIIEERKEPDLSTEEKKVSEEITDALKEAAESEAKAADGNEEKSQEPEAAVAEEKAASIIERSARKGIHTVSRYDADFPKMLHTTVGEDGKPSVPVLLYYKGDLSITERPALAVIGTREPDSYGWAAGHSAAGHPEMLPGGPFAPLCFAG